MTIFDFQQVCYDSLVTTSTTYRVTLHGYVTCSYAGYAKHGYATWLCHMWLRRLCQNLVTPRIVMSVTPYTVTPRGYAGYAKFGYATWLRYAWSCRLRHTRLLHMVTLPRPISRSH